jgi:hypothetical protein
MSSPYDPVKLAQDATAFADSDFGAHYLARLISLRNDQYAIVRSDKYTDSQRAHAGTRADVLSGEIEYFNTARTIQSDQSLIQRVRTNFERRMKKRDI